MVSELVSVIIPAYERPQLLLERSLPSVLAQTHRNLDVHVVGDGATPEVVAAMATVTDPRVRFTQRPRPVYPQGDLNAWHVSGSHAVNYALDTARGDWICGMGDDDELYPEYVERLLSEALRQGVDIIYCRSEVIHNGRVKGYLGRWPPRHGGQAGGEWLWRKNSVRLDPECWRKGMPNDWDFHSRMLLSGMKCGFVPDVLYKYYPSKHVPPCNLV